MFPERNGQDKSLKIQCNFSACTDAVMEQVPSYVRPPIIFTARAAMERSVQHMVRRNVINGKSFQDESDALREVHHQRFYEQALAYYEYLKAKAVSKQRDIASMFKAAEASNSSSKTPEAFPLPKIGEFRAGMGAGFLREAYLTEFKHRQDHLACHLASIGGKALGGDHTFQTAKHVTEAGGEKAYEAVFDIINEYGQIVCLLFTGTKSMVEIAPQLVKLYEAWEELNAQVSFGCVCCCHSSLPLFFIFTVFCNILILILLSNLQRKILLISSYPSPVFP